jgi:benzoate-CoA ligase family protein
MTTAQSASPLVFPRTLNIAGEFIDGPVARGHGSKVAVHVASEPSEDLTYADLQQVVNRGARALQAAGIEMEQRVAILLPDSSAWLAAFYGAAKLGAVPVPLNTILPPSDHVYLLNDSRARALVVDAAIWAGLKERRSELPWLQRVFVSAGDEGSDRCWGDALKAAETSFEAAPTTCDDVAFWLYSSGSTGAPKGAVHLQHDMLVCERLYSRSILRLTEGDTVLSAAKLFHAYGFGNSSYFPFAAGAKSILYPGRVTPQAMFDLIASEQVTVFFGVPTLYAQMLQYADSGAACDCSSLRLCVSAAEPLPADICRRWKARFGTDILDGIGTTEALHIFISNRAAEVVPGSSGFPVPGYDVRLVDEQGTNVPRGEIGALEIRGDSALAYYWNQHERTKQTVKGEWLTTGDKYWQDENGCYWYAGRNDDMLKVGGRWVSPAEVEGALIEHASVLEAAVVGLKDSDDLVKPKAFVILRNGVEPAESLAMELQEFVKTRIAPYKYPRWIEFVAELPKTATGKIQRFRLRGE